MNSLPFPEVSSRSVSPATQSSPPVDVRPVLRLQTTPFFVEAETKKGWEVQERELATLRLSFDYGSLRIAANATRRGFFVAAGEGVLQVARDDAFEHRARCLLESFGALEVDCVPGLEGASEEECDYLISLDGNVHTICSFLSYAIPQLEGLGWRIERAPGFPYQVVRSETPWYADVTEDEEKGTDWFSFELGVDVNGTRINLLPALLEMLKGGSESDTLDSLFRTHARFRALSVGGQRYVVIPPERLRKLLHVLEQLYDGKSEQIRLHPAAAAALSDLEESFSGQQPLRWYGKTNIVELGRELTQGAETLPSSEPKLLKAKLRPYQQVGVDWLQNLSAHDAGGILADDMGLGKTLQTIAFITLQKQAKLEGPVLVIVPKSLIGNWLRELKKFAPFLRTLAIQGSKRSSCYERIAKADVVITSYPVVNRDVAKLHEHEYHCIILDEAQTIKNSRSQVTVAVKSLAARHRLCLTGTPIENNLGELWSLFDFLMPGFLGSERQFRERYRQPIERENNERRLMQLRALVAPYLLRRMKDTVATELPPKTELVRPVELQEEQRDLYENIRIAAHSDVRKMIRKKGLLGSTVTILDALMKLRQVCCDPRLVKSSIVREVERSAKLEFLLEFMTQQLSQGRRILLFSQFTEMLGLIGSSLRERDIKYLGLTGATQNRQAKVDAFEKGAADVFLISLKAGGTGLNLTSADTVIHYDPWWNPAAQAQATDRAYRIGQKRPVFVYNLIVAGSVEERILRLQQRKKQLANTILEGGPHGALSEEDIEDLFQPLD